MSKPPCCRLRRRPAPSPAAPQPRWRSRKAHAAATGNAKRAATDFKVRDRATDATGLSVYRSDFPLPSCARFINARYAGRRKGKGTGAARINETLCNHHRHPVPGAAHDAYGQRFAHDRQDMVGVAAGGTPRTLLMPAAWGSQRMIPGQYRDSSARNASSRMLSACSTRASSPADPLPGRRPAAVRKLDGSNASAVKRTCSPAFTILRAPFDRKAISTRCSSTDNWHSSSDSCLMTKRVPSARKRPAWCRSGKAAPGRSCRGRLHIDLSAPQREQCAPFPNAARPRRSRCSAARGSRRPARPCGFRPRRYGIALALQGGTRSDTPSHATGNAMPSTASMFRHGAPVQSRLARQHRHAQHGRYRPPNCRLRRCARCRPVRAARRRAPALECGMFVRAGLAQMQATASAPLRV